MGLINWQEAEKYTTWAMSKTTEETIGWDSGADGWQRRTAFDKEFTQAQVDACTRINKDTTVLDACCGAGRTAIPFAKKAKQVIAVDAGPNMLAYCAKYAEAEGLDNVITKRIPNWHTAEPGVDFPIADIAVSVIGPPQADILNFSRFATKYCYFLSYTKDRYMLAIQEIFNGTSAPKEGMPPMPPRPVGDPAVNALLRGRQNGCFLDVQFNILYEHGALPEISYADGAWAHEAASREEIYEYLRAFGQVDADKEEIFRANCDKRISRKENGIYRYAYESQMYVLGWDPSRLR